MILDTFTIDFKSNAKVTQQDIANLDKQIASLHAKKDKLSEDEIKSLGALGKQRKQAIDDFKNLTSETDKLGASFGKILEGGAAAFGAFTAFGAIKTGILDVTNFNSALNITATRTGQNVTQLRTLDAALESIGAKRGAGLQLFSSVFEQQSASGLPTTSPRQLLKNLYNTVHGLSPEAAEINFQRSGLGGSDPAIKAFLRTATPDQFNQTLAAGEANSKLTAEQAKTAQAFENQLAETHTVLAKEYTRMAQDILPSVNTALKFFADFLNGLSGHTGEAVVAGGTVISSILAALGGAKILKSVLGIGGSGVSGGAGLLSLLSKAFGITAVVTSGYQTYGAISDLVTGKRESTIGKGANALANTDAAAYVYDTIISLNSYKKYSGNKGKINDLLLQGGLSQDNANGILANLFRESGYDPAADPRKRGGTENAYGIAQWGAARQADFAKLFGHDIRSSTIEEQVQFLLWELNNTRKKTGSALRGANSAQSAALFSQGFEQPHDALGEAIARGNLANDIARQNLSIMSPQSSNSEKNYNVKIDAVNVHTQATDAQGIASAASDHLVGQIRQAFSQWDDGAFA